MRRGTTPTFTLFVPGYDLTDMTVYVTIMQVSSSASTMLTLTGNEISITADEEGSMIAFQLPQTQTLKFTKGKADVQVRFIDANGNAGATDTGTINIQPILLDGVITYDGNNT